MTHTSHTRLIMSAGQRVAWLSSCPSGCLECQIGRLLFHCKQLSHSLKGMPAVAVQVCMCETNEYGRHKNNTHNKAGRPTVNLFSINCRLRVLTLSSYSSYSVNDRVNVL